MRPHGRFLIVRVRASDLSSNRSATRHPWPRYRAGVPSSDVVEPRLRVSAALVVAALVAWLAPASVIALRLAWRDHPARVPVHWTGAGPDQWASADAAFWSCIVPGIVGALVCSLLVVPLSSDGSRWGTAITFGTVSAGTGIIAFFWIAMTLAAERAPVPFLVVLAPLGLGVLVSGLSLLMQKSTAR